ncbi:MAG: hypothetical protein OXH36_00405 [Bdellovibrionales bacterium]|nr:hypothetical protein [Bdellovibrionales bacterium]
MKSIIYVMVIFLTPIVGYSQQSIAKDSMLQDMLKELNYISTEITNISSDVSGLDGMIRSVHQQMTFLQGEINQIETDIKDMEKIEKEIPYKYK